MFTTKFYCLHDGLEKSRLAGDKMWHSKALGRPGQELQEGDIVLIRNMAGQGEVERLGIVQEVHSTSASVLTRKDKAACANRYKLNDLIFICHPTQT